MTAQVSPARLPAIGVDLPPATRFCLVPDDDARTLGKRRLVGFIPCDRFEQNGWHLLSADGVLRIRECRGLPNGGGIEIISAVGNKVLRAEQFSAIVAGRVVGIALLDMSSALLAVPFDTPPINKALRKAAPAIPAGPAQIVKNECPADPSAIERAASEWAKLEEIVDRLGFAPVPMDPGFQRWMYLRPFVAWCISRGKRPADVRSDDITLYIDGRRRTGGFAMTKFKRAQMLRQAWNYAVQKFTGWPSQMLALDRPRRHTSVPVVKHGQLVSFEIARYHPSLVAEVKAYRESGGFLGHESRDRPRAISHHERMLSKLVRLSTVGVGELLASSTHRQRKLCTKTLNEHGHLIYRAATALHLAGAADIRDLQHIADVATPQAAALLADRITAGWRAGTRPTSYAALSVYTLCAIARRCGVHYSIAQLMAVRDLAHELLRDVETTRDLSSTNLDRLIQFDDRRTFAMLVALPDVVMKELEDDRESGRAVTLKWARIAETAIAIEILNTLPVRISTLSALDLKRNFVPPSHRKGDGKLIIYGDQEKSEKRLEASLSPRTWRLISLHCRHYRPILPGADRGSLLFPTVAVVNYPWSSRFGERIALLVKKRLKVTVTTHLWRHIMGSRLQEYSDQPNDGEKLLGHIPGSDATKRYIRVRTNEAAKRLRELTDAVRSEGAKQLGYKRHRVRSRPRGGPTAPLASDD